MELCSKCKKNPRTPYDKKCLKCMAKARRKRYATDKEFRESEKSNSIKYQKNRWDNDPIYKQKKIDYDIEWKKANKERFIFLQARSLFNRLSPYYKKKLLKELNLDYRKP